MLSEEKKAIEYLKILKKHLGKDKQEMIDTGTYKFYEAFETNLDIVLNYITKLQKENKELKSDNLEKARILEMFDDRKYRKKYLEERRKEEPNLLYPDGDEIYKRYYEQKKQIDFMLNFIYEVLCKYPGTISHALRRNGFNDNECGTCENTNKNCIKCLKLYFESKSKEE